MNVSDHITLIVVLISIGALVMGMSMNRTKRILKILPESAFKLSWKKLRLLMLVFLIGYLAVALLVITGETKFLALLSGVIFLMGSLFVFFVVSTSLASFKKLKNLNRNLDDTEIKNKELEQFAYMTSHDLKAPLRGISSLATFIEQDLKTGQTQEVYNNLEALQGQVEHLENLINGILNYSKIGKISIESVDLKALILKEFRNYPNSHTIKYTIIGELPVLQGDKIQLSQVVSNLIGNAVKYNDKEVCEITISSKKNRDSYNVFFKDNGPGISPDYHHKIFELFQTLVQRDDSTGIGLTIVKKIIEKHKGSINVESDGKLGTTFVISLPKLLE